MLLLLQPIPLGVTFSKAQSSKLERLVCHVSVKRDVRALSFELLNSIRKCHPKWDWLYFERNSLVTLLEAQCARILFFRFVNIGFFLILFFVCARPLSLKKAFLPPLSTRLLCLIVTIPLVCWLYMCACVCVPLYMNVKVCR